MSSYPCCECCQSDPLHPDVHVTSCPTCNNPIADRLRAEVERLTKQIEAAKKLGRAADRWRPPADVLNDVLRTLDPN